MTPMVVAVAHVPASSLTSGVVTVVASGLSGLELAGTVGGLAAAVAAVIGLGLTVAASNRARRREFAADLAAAKADGTHEAAEHYEPLLDQAKERADQAQRDAEFWRREFMKRVGPLPGPGSEPQ